MQDVIKIRRGAKATINNALVKGIGTAIDVVDFTDGKGAGHTESIINITNTLDDSQILGKRSIRNQDMTISISNKETLDVLLLSLLGPTIASKIGKHHRYL